ncbi:hypothetical protein NFI96_010698, partial [Prochilodus magdalenae]
FILSCRLWILFIALCLLKDASGYGVWDKGSREDQASADVSAPLPLFPKPGFSLQGGYLSRAISNGGQPSVVSSQTSSSSGMAALGSQDPSQSQPGQLTSQMPSSVAGPASGFAGYQSVFQRDRFGGSAALSQLLPSANGLTSQLQGQGVSGMSRQGALQWGSSSSLSQSGLTQPSAQGFPGRYTSTRVQTTSSQQAASQQQDGFATQLQQQGVPGAPQSALQQGSFGSFQSVPSGLASQYLGTRGQTTPQQQGGLWTSSGQAGRPRPSVPLASQPQRSADQLSYSFQMGTGSQPLSSPQSSGGGLTAASPQSFGASYSSPGLYASQGVSHGRSGPLPQLTARLFTSQGASMTSSSLRPTTDLGRQTGSPSLTLPSQGATTWQAPSSFQPGFQSAPSQVQSAPSGQYAGVVAGFDQYSPASQTSRAYELSRVLSGSYGGVQSQPGFAQTGSVAGLPQSPVAQAPSGSASGSPSFYGASPSLSSAGDSFTRGLSDASYFRPAPQRVSPQYDPSVKH